MKVNKKNTIRLVVITLIVLVVGLLTPVYIKNGGFYFDDQGLVIDKFRFRTANTQLFRIYNESSRKGDVLLWFRHKGKNRCIWIFQMYQETHLDLKTQCEGLMDQDFVINVEWSASNPRLVSSAQRLGTAKDFF